MDSLSQTFSPDKLTQMLRGFFMSTKLANALSGLLMILILLMLSLFAWKIWQSYQPTELASAQNSGKTNKRAQSSVNINRLTSYHLFGNPQASSEAPQSSEINAPVTRLKLKLRGVYASSEPELAGAMIEAQNKQQVYRIGDKVPGASGLKLHQILSDRIILSRGGKFETLLIEDFGKIKGLSTPSRTSSNRVQSTNQGANKQSNVLDKRKDKNLTKELIKLRANLSDPSSLGELISVAPAMENGQFIGFRLSPGKNRSLFGRLGLRRNDIVTNVNGISLDDPASAFNLMEQISSANEINLAIKRGSRTLNILFSASQ